MDREFLFLRLARVEQSVAESKAYVARQQQRIVELERDGQDTAETFRLLGKLLPLQRLCEQEREKVLDELSEAS